MFAVGLNALEVRIRDGLATAARACLEFRLDQSVAIAGFRHEASVLWTENVPVRHVVQTRSAGHLRVHVRLVFRTDAGVDPHLARVGPKVRTEANVARPEVRLHRCAQIRPDVRPVWTTVGLLHVRFAVLDEDRHGDLLRRLVLHILRLQLLRVLDPGAFVLVPSILEPDFHLSAGQLQRLRQHLPFRGAEVSLLFESLLQFVDLCLRSGSFGI